MTLNCWAIGYVPVLKSPDRGIRIEAIALHLKTCGDQYDVVCLQELWLQSDRTKIVERSIETFPYSKEFQGGVIGTGLLILSKYPLQDPSYKLFSMNGYLHQIWYGDSWCGSGIGTAWIELPNGFKVLICTSHFHAEYNRDDDQFLPDRICQALEGIKEIESKEHLVDGVIYAGDFNTEPQDLPHQILIKMSGFQDARGDETPKPSYNAEWNTYASPQERPVTIDYIMIGTNEDTKVITTHCQNPLSPKISGQSISYSDHEGVWAQIKFQDQKDIAYDKPEAYDVETLNGLNSQLRDVLRLERSKLEWSMWIIFMVSAAFLSVWKWEGPWSIFIALILSYLFYLGGQFFNRITAISSQIDTIMALMNPVKK